jgi:hypothetical protein
MHVRNAGALQDRVRNQEVCGLGGFVARDDGDYGPVGRRGFRASMKACRWRSTIAASTCAGGISMSGSQPASAADTKAARISALALMNTQRLCVF